ncbi:MAG: DNA mismatch repair endonuclease MutL [Bacteroidales bacterium]|nr:DNA mismatch repair endonuclease MutL [Bacteroidales bacterium]
MNSDVIKLLPDSVANQIAAGEVIQRPASVIKELVENAVDAGAKHISIILKDAGRTLIQVVDDGCGMSPTDARMAFERHATSKISSADDLYTLHTMGFRGEALPSIAAVAQIDLRTMRHGESVGTRLLISESKFEGQEPCACAPGSNMMVKNIFFHMPARRKFLKKDSIELGHILREFERLALVNTDIDFSLIHNDTTLHQFPAGSFKQRIISLFGKSMESQLARIGTETSMVKISGYIGMPRSAKKRGAQQFLFVNGRNMRHPFFHKAILKSYEQLIPSDAQPSYFINFEVDPSTIDVNIHPQKHEIKFEYEQAIWQILVASIKETLGKTQAAGALDFDSDEAPEIPLFQPDSSIAMPDEGATGDFNPFRPASDNGSGAGFTNPFGSKPRPASVPRDWDQLFDSFTRQREEAFTSTPEFADAVPAPQTPALDFPEDEMWRPASDNSTPTEASPAGTTGFFQLQGEYIVGAGGSGIMVISQHRAHLRVLYDRFMSEISRGQVASQQIFFPEAVEMPASVAATLDAHLPLLEQIGFGLERQADGKWYLTATPGLLGTSNPMEALNTILDQIVTTEEPDIEAMKQPIALSMARSAAIRSGKTLSTAEMDALVADLFRSSDPSFTPDGLTILSVIGIDQINQLFK